MNGGRVCGPGPFTGGELRELDSFEAYLCPASPAECSRRPAQVLRVRIDAGSRQCRPGTGLSRLDTRRRLTDGSVRMMGSGCSYGSFGVPAVCGASDARYRMFDIDAADAARAAALGYPPVDAESCPGKPNVQACRY